MVNPSWRFDGNERKYLEQVLSSGFRAGADGVFILGTPNFDSGAARRYGNKFRLLNDPTHISLFSSDSMHRCLRDLGFFIEKVEYPYFDTYWFTKENLLKLLNPNTISPPFYGSNMTFFCKIKDSLK